MLSSDLLLHGDPYDWLRRGGANGHKNGREGALFLVPKRALQQILAAEVDDNDIDNDNAAAAASNDKGAADGTEQGSAALVSSSSSSALALLERGQGYRVTLPGLLTQAQAQSGGGAGAAFGNAPPPELLAQTVRGLAVVAAPPGGSGGRGGQDLDPERLKR